MNKGTAIVGFILCFLAGMGLMYGVDRSEGVEIAKEDGQDTGKRGGIASHANAIIPITDEDPSWGNADALVTIVEFSDFQCPFCSRVLPTIDKIKKEYGPDKVRVVFKQQPLPFHKQAGPAAAAAIAVKNVAGDEAFWKFHDLAFANAKDLTDANFEKWAAESGADVAKFKAELASGRPAKKVEADQAVAQKVGATGTPAFRINGVTLAGAQPFEKFKEVVDAQLAEAQKLVASGVKKSEVYPQLVDKNAKAAPAQAADKQPERKDPADDKTVWKVPVDKDDPVRGPKDAAVTVVMWSDYQCPFCKRVEPTIQKLVEEYKNDIRVVWKDNALPFHPRAKPAATLARVAYEEKGDKGYWEAHDALMESAPKLEDQDLEEVAKKVGVSWTKVKAAIDSDKYGAAIAADMDMANEVEARGTPHFFINGRRLSGAQPYEKFKPVVDQELARAKATLAKGVSKDKLYEELIKDGKTPPPPEKKDVGAPPASAPWKGNPNAKIVIQEFSDYECPFCSRVEPTIKEVMDKYGNEVKVVWRNLPLPFHKNAQLAAEASVEVHKQKGNDAFWKYHEKLFANQKALAREDLEKYAEEIGGIDMAKFKAALDQRTHQAVVDADKAAADKAGVRGTPGFTVNGYFISGAQPFGQFKKMIDLAKKEAK